jgi:LDH2 family malate/lactate/ureidoglycolate dehydrogenase
MPADIPQGSIGITHAELHEFASAVFRAVGLPSRSAAVVAESLVTADLRGTHSHGVVRLPFLVRRLRDGGANLAPVIRIVSDAPATALIDGDRGLGALTATHAMELAIIKARSAGIGYVAARNSDFIGTCAHYAMMALPADMIGIAWTNGFPGMSAWGGRRNAIGNNPIALAAPSGSAGPVVLDMALSVAAGGRVRLAAKRNERIPHDWLIDHDGRSTDDPAALAAGGALLPLGYKGYGLAVFGEILCGVLTGSRVLGEVRQWFSDTGQSVGNGHLHVAIDIRRFIAVDEFRTRVDAVLATLKSSPRMPGVDEILAPGERAWRTSQRQERAGIAIDAHVARDLAALAVAVDVTPPATFTTAVEEHR